MRTWRAIFFSFLFVLFFFGQASAKVVGIGQAMYDVYFSCSEPILSNFIKLEYIKKKGGCELVSPQQAQHIRDTLKDKMTHQSAGGSLANSLASLKKLGSDVSFYYAIADDDYGRAFLSEIKALGISSHHTLLKGPSDSTGFVHALVSEDGERTMLAQPGSSCLIDASSLNQKLEDFDYVLSEAFLLYNEKSSAMLHDIFLKSRGTKVKTVLSLSSESVIFSYRDKLKKLLENTDILFGNEEEFFALFEVKTITEVVKKLKPMNLQAIITRGALGAAIIEKDGFINIAVERVLKPVDATGAGDIFLAGFLHGLERGKSLEECAAWGNKAASLIIQQVGARFNQERDLSKLFN